MRGCAYCDAQAPLTDEHVWPSCFLNRMGRKAAHLAPQSGRAHGADYVVADVCAECNNVRLEPLDQHFCKLYDDFIVRTRTHPDTLTLHYEFSALARTLLKIAYNSSRCAGNHSASLRAQRHFIAGLGQPTLPFAILVELLPAAPPPTGEGSLAPGLYRCAETAYPIAVPGAIVSRMIQIDGVRFHVIVAVDADVYAFEDAMRAILDDWPGVVRLDPAESEAPLTRTRTDPLQGLDAHIARHHHTYEQFFNRQRE